MRIVTRRLRLGSSAAIVGAAALASAWFTSRAWSHAAGVAPPLPPPVVASPAAASPLAVTPADPRSTTAELLARNMFCSTCAPPRDDGPAERGASPVARALPRVIATQVGRHGWATLEAGNVAGAFVLGAALPGGGVLESIEPGAIVVRFDAETTVRVALASEANAGSGGDTAGKPSKRGDGAATADPWADRIRAVGDNRWEVDRKLIRELVAAGTGGTAAARGVRLQPVNKDGQLAGVRVTAARSGSLATALGLSAGDVIESIDGRAIDSPQVLMSMYDKLDGLRRVDLGVRRKGSAVTLTYDLP